MNKKIFLFVDWLAFVVMPIVLRIIYSSGNAHLYKQRGSMSLNVLYLIMFMKPIIIIVGQRSLYQCLPYRRQLGVMATWLAIFHTIGLIVVKNLRNVSSYLTNPWSNYLFIGVLATIGMMILALTSNFWSIKFFGKNWKRIQRLAYPTLFLGKLHADLSKGMGKVGQHISTTSSVSWTKFMPTIGLLIVFIGLKYRQHKVQTKQWRSLSEIYSTD